MILYINDLRNLPNLGCRSTGAALEEMLGETHSILRRDGRETIHGSGWDSYSLYPLRFGGILPGKLYDFFWGGRFKNPGWYKKICNIDKLFGAMHDFICEDPEISVQKFILFSQKDTACQELLEQIKKCEAVAINGEGTLIFSNPMGRDALYLLFIIALARVEKKPVYLLNAMVAKCPYTDADENIIKKAGQLLSYCNRIACRDETSFLLASKISGSENLDLIPDALFSWGERIRVAKKAIRISPDICIPFQSKLSYAGLSFSTPYICIAGSSSGWRYEDTMTERLNWLVDSLKKLTCNIYFIETCTGDSYLRSVAQVSGLPLIPKETSVLSAAGIIAGASLLISGRYHPSIIASAGGVPCIFLGSNSHKTVSLQKLLKYENIREYPVDFDKSDTDSIVERANRLICNSNLKSKILDQFNFLSEKSKKYKYIIE